MGLLRSFLFAATLCALAGPLSGAEAPQVLTLTLDRGTSLRELAKRYLEDPDAWPQILHASGLSSVDQLRPGVELRIPVGASLELARALAALHRLIYQATEAGALILAQPAIEDAMSRQAAAATARRAGALEEANRLAAHGIRAATAALSHSLERRGVPAEAILGSAGGRVERRRPTELDWTRIPVDTLLAEAERLRTLAESFAVVRFRDASRIRMGEHSHLVIQHLREDRLTRREEVGVLLYGGDLRALIGAEASRQILNVQTEGIETQSKSRDYWVEKTPERARLANFDGEVAVTAEGTTVQVRKDQGTLVERGDPPLEPVDLLPAPELIAPSEGAQVFDVHADLRWSAVPSAAAYWLEVARDPGLTELVLSDTDVTATHLGLSLGEDGRYYWRVSAVDASGLPGPAAPLRQFLKARDEIPPYLQLRRPAAGLHIDAAELLIEGQTEQRARLAINGDAIPTGPEGAFRHRLSLAPGINRLRFEARDAAGNTKRLERVVHRSPGGTLPLTLAPGLARDTEGRLLVNRPWLTLSGEAPAGTRVRATSADMPEFAAEGAADASGRFGLTVRVDRPMTRLDLTAVGPDGRQRRETVELVLDQTPPVIHLDPEPPQRSAQPTLSLQGRLEGGDALYLDDQEAPLDAKGHFRLEARLRPGLNRLTLVARDRAGNLARWQRGILLDQQPPKLEDYRLISAEQAGQPVLVVEIQAEDESGLVASVPYRVRSGDWVRQGLAQRCANRRCYRDRFLLPPGADPGVRLSAVTLEDYLGNRREVQID